MASISLTACIWQEAPANVTFIDNAQVVSLKPGDIVFIDKTAITPAYYSANTAMKFLWSPDQALIDYITDNYPLIRPQLALYPAQNSPIVAQFTAASVYQGVSFLEALCRSTAKNVAGLTGFSF